MHLEPGKVKLIQQNARIGMLQYILKVRVCGKFIREYRQVKFPVLNNMCPFIILPIELSSKITNQVRNAG